MFNTAYIGLFDRSLLHLSSLELTSKSHTPVSMYQFDPIGLVLLEIIKTSHAQIFLFFSIMERIRKGSDLPKKNWGSLGIQQKYWHIKLTPRSPALCFVEFSTQCVPLKMTWHVRA